MQAARVLPQVKETAIAITASCLHFHRNPRETDKEHMRNNEINGAVIADADNNNITTTFDLFSPYLILTQYRV